MQKKLPSMAWGMSGLVIAVAIAAWLETNNGRIITNPYRVFPLLGIVAFSLMWVHYIIGALRQYFEVPKAALKPYFEATSALVLVALLLHPGLLVFQQWRRGMGLPPGSYLSYVAPGARWAVMLGVIGFVIFLLFELRRKFDQTPWWRWVEAAQVFAMAAIFIHALRLGAELQGGWYRAVWVVYGITFVAAVGYSYYKDMRKKV